MFQWKQPSMCPKMYIQPMCPLSSVVQYGTKHLLKKQSYIGLNGGGGSRTTEKLMYEVDVAGNTWVWRYLPIYISVCKKTRRGLRQSSSRLARLVVGSRRSG